MSGAPATIVFAEVDNLFRLMEMALLRRTTPAAQKTLEYFFGPDHGHAERDLLGMADALGLPGGLDVTVAQSEDELVGLLPRTDVLVLERTALDRRRLELSRPRVKLVQQFGKDCRHIDLDAARDLAIPVADLLRLSNLSCADHLVGLVLALARNLMTAQRRVLAQRDAARTPAFETGPPRNTFNWARVRDIRVLAEHTIGFIGMGEIASLTAQRLRAMGMRVLYVKRSRLSAAEEAALGGIEFAERDGLLAQSDFVSINVPYSPATETMVDAAFLAAMKPGAYLINTARGGIVDERALDAALRSGHLAGAALDVHRYEPVPADCPLLDIDTIVWTPHMAGGQPEFMVRESRDVLANIARALRGERAASLITP